MICKPFDWDEVDRDFVQVPENVVKLTADELGVDERMLATFKFQPPQCFILVRDAREYYVDTQGYNYIRYIHRIK